MKRVVVTGFGVVTPSGIGISEFWKNSLSGKSGISSFQDFPEFKLNSRVVGRVKDFDYKKYNISNTEVKRMGRPVQFAIAAAQEALNLSKIDLIRIGNKEKMGVCISNAIADTPCSEQQFIKLYDYYQNKDKFTKEEVGQLIDKDFYSKCTFNCISTEISSRYHLNGHVFTMSTGCVSGIDAIGYAYECIKNEDMDLMICGATEAPITLLTLASFDVIGATSKKNYPPEKASSPFDATRDGFVLSEGAGIIILESLEHAQSRKAPILAEILSYETSNNAWHMTSLPEDGEPIVKIMNLAINNANIKPEDIEYINAHGSSTPQNDIFETSAYKKVFGNSAYNIPISANKSIIGHPLGAASAIEFVRSCLIFQHGKIPPTINLEHPDEKCDLDYVPNIFREKKINYMMTDASGFSGIHSVMIMKNSLNI
jgi:3-oxoacyl-(acyl-carrier-protein) synthase